MNEQNVKHTQGNLLKLGFPILRRQVTTVNGQRETVDTEFIPDGTLIIRLQKGFHSFDYTPETEGNFVSFTDMGKLTVGTYDLTVLYTDAGNQPYRWKHPQALCIVDSSEDGDTYNSAVLDAEADVMTVLKRISALVIDENGVTVNEGGYYGGDEDPNDDFADANAHFGNGKVEIDENYVTLNI